MTKRIAYVADSGIEVGRIITLPLSEPWPTCRKPGTFKVTDVRSVEDYPGIVCVTLESVFNKAPKPRPKTKRPVPPWYNKFRNAQPQGR